MTAENHNVETLLQKGNKVMMSQFDQRAMQVSLSTRAIRMVVSILIFIACITLTVILWVAVNEQDITEGNLPAETVTITRVKKHLKRNVPNNYYAQIDGKEVEIHNINGYPQKGDTVTAYFYKGKYYGSVIGAKHSTGIGTIYFVFLALCMAALWYMLLEIVYFKRKLKGGNL